LISPDSNVANILSSLFNALKLFVLITLKNSVPVSQKMWSSLWKLVS